MREKNGKFAKGHQITRKLTSEALMKQAYEQYCKHIASGKCKRSWYFKHPEISLTARCLETYIKENPTIFPAIQQQMAEAEAYEHWEALGKKMMIGDIKGGMPVIYQMFMRNKFGWDKETTTHHTFEPEARKLLAKLEGR